MNRTPYNLTQDDKRCYLDDGCIHTWNEMEQLILQYFPKHVDLQIPIFSLPTVPEYYEPRLGAPDGQGKNLGCSVDDGRGIHLKVYSRKRFYRMHWDAKDPKKDPWGHLKDDAPEYLAAIIIGGIIGIGTGYAIYKHRQNKKKL